MQNCNIHPFDSVAYHLPTMSNTQTSGGHNRSHKDHVTGGHLGTVHFLELDQKFHTSNDPNRLR